MEPLPEEVLADARRVLDDVIRPAIQDEFAREQAGLLSSLLEHVRLRITLEPDHLVADTADMRGVLGGLDLPVHVGAALQALPARSVDTVGLDTLRAENIALRQVLADTVDALEGAAGAGETPPALKEVRGLLRRQLDRDREMIGPGYPKGT